MTRISSSAVAILLCLLQSSPSTSASSIIDANGVFNPRADIPESSMIDTKGIVAIISSPGTKSFFDSDNNHDDGAVTLTSSDDGVSILSSSGATLSTSVRGNGNGAGAAAAASVAGSIIVSGITESDLEYGLHASRHGQTLTGIFRAKLENVQETEPVTETETETEVVETEEGEEEAEVEETTQSTKLYLVMPPCDTDADSIKKDVEKIFDTVLAEKDIAGITFDSLFETSIVYIENEEEAKEVLAQASEAATTTPPTPNFLSSIGKAYSSVTKSSSPSSSEMSSSATAAILACDDSFARHNRAVRAKVASWKSRTKRGLTVDNFGSAATQLMERSMESYDRDTLMAAGSSTSAASHRLEMRTRLQGKVENGIRELFQVQVGILQKTTLKKFNAMLLRQHGGKSSSEGTEQFYNDNAAAMRAAAFSFETSVQELEVPSLSLTKARAVAEIDMKLGVALNEFPDSPAARLKNMKEVSQVVNKQKKPTERSIDFGLDLVGMIRPDGFGNMQGFAGYQMGGNNIIVGVHNDADAPDVISQFGGKRPPFIRVQPKLKVEVEL